MTATLYIENRFRPSDGDAPDAGLFVCVDRYTPPADQFARSPLAGLSELVELVEPLMLNISIRQVDLDRKDKAAAELVEYVAEREAKKIAAE